MTGKIECIENGSSGGLSGAKVQKELLFANREIVRESDFSARLSEINKVLENIPEPPSPLGPIALAETEGEMDQAILNEAKGPQKHDTPISTWATKTMSYTFRFISTALMTIGGFTVCLLGLYSLFAGLPAGILMSLIGGPLLALGIALNPHGPLPDVTFRNKVLRRKAYKREVRRLLGEAEYLRHRNASLQALRHRALEEARAALEPLDADFRLKNPGDALEICLENGAAVKIVRDSSYTNSEYIAARAMGGSGNRKAIQG